MINSFILYDYVGHKFGNWGFYKLIANIPIKNPTIFPIAVILPWYSLFDSGINSP